MLMIQASIMDELKGRVRGGYTEQRRAQVISFQ